MRKHLRTSVRRRERGIILVLTLILSSLGIVASTSLLAVVGGHIQSTKGFQLRHETYYSAKAAMESAIADMLQGQDLLAPGYQPPQVTLDGVTSAVSVASPTASFRPKTVYRFLDPGTKTGLASLAPGATWSVRLEGVQPFSIVGAGWAFDDASPPDVEVSVEEPGGAKAVTQMQRAKSPLQLVVRAGTPTQYTVHFKNIGTTAVVSKPFSSLGGDDKTWIIAKMAGHEYLLHAAAGSAFALKAYIRQVPGPNQPGPVPQIIVVETWTESRASP